MNQIFSKPVLLASAAFLAAATIVGCKSDSTAPSATPAAIAANTSPPVSATVASPIAGPTVKVTDAGGNPVEGALVTFAVTAGGGVIQYPTATSDENGIASSGLWQIGPKVGVNTLAAAIQDVAPISFTVTSLPGQPTKVAVNSGDGQTAAQSATVPNPLSVRVTDAGGNVKPGVVVTFAVTAGGGSITGATATTDVNGIATSGAWTFGTCKGQVVRASSGALGANFSGRATGQPAMVGGAAAGDLATTDCVINGAYADEYDYAATAGAFNYTMTATFDALLNVTNDAGLVTIASDDNGGGGTNSSLRLIGVANTKTVTATSAGAGQTGPYSVTVTSTSSDVTDCSPVYLEIGASTSQTLSTTDCTTNYSLAAGGGGVAGDAFLVYVPAGVTIRVTQTAQPLDALFAIFSPTGTRLVERDNGGIGPNSSEVFNMTAATSGFYKVVASSYCLVYDDPYTATCSYGPYTLTVITP